jgi:hypothetical protein
MISGTALPKNVSIFRRFGNSKIFREEFRL